MLDTPLFLKSKAARRTHMVMRSYERIAKQFAKVNVELKQLNGWMKLMPGLMANEGADFPNAEQWDKAISSYAKSTDNLACAMIENGHLMEELRTALEFYQKYSDDL